MKKIFLTLFLLLMIVSNSAYSQFFIRGGIGDSTITGQMLASSVWDFINASVDSIGVDTDGDGTVDNYIYPAYLKRGANITFTVSGDTLTISGPAASGTADSLGIDADGNGTIDNYLYSTVGGAFHLKKGANITFSVSGDTLTISGAAGSGTSDSLAVDTSGTGVFAYIYSIVGQMGTIREGSGINLTANEDTFYIAATLGTFIEDNEVNNTITITGLGDSTNWNAAKDAVASDSSSWSTHTVEDVTNIANFIDTIKSDTIPFADTAVIADTSSYSKVTDTSNSAIQNYVANHSRDSIGIDTDGNGTTDSYIYPSYIKKGANVTLSVAGDTLTIAGPASSGTADSLGVDTDGDGTIDNYLYSTIGGAFHLKEGANVTFTVTADTLEISGPAAAGTADSMAVDTSGTGVYAYLYSTVAGGAFFLREGTGIDLTVLEDSVYINFAIDTSSWNEAYDSVFAWGDVRTDIEDLANDTSTWRNVSTLFDSVYQFISVDSGIIDTLYSNKLDVTGNITITGTVDGIDISSHAADASAHHTKTTSVDDITNIANFIDTLTSDSIPVADKAVAADSATIIDTTQTKFTTYIANNQKIKELGDGDTLAITGETVTDTLLKITKTAGKVTITTSLDTLQIGPEGLLYLDSGEVLNYLRYVNGTDTMTLTAALVDSMVNQLGVYATGAGSVDSFYVADTFVNIVNNWITPEDTLFRDTTQHLAIQDTSTVFDNFFDTAIVVDTILSSLTDANIPDNITITGLSDSSNWNDAWDSIQAWDNAALQLPDDNIKMDTLGTSLTYTNVEDWFNITQSAMIISGGVITQDATDSTVADVTSGTAILKTTNSNIGSNVFYNFNAANDVAITDSTDGYIYLDYNSGTPTIAFASISSINLNTQVIIGRVHREGNHMHITQAGQNFSNYATKDSYRLFERYGLHRVSGMVTSEGGDASNDIDVTAGVAYLGANRITTNAVASFTDGVELYYLNGTGGFTRLDSTALNDESYDDGDGTRAALLTNRYNIFWIYLMSDNQLYAIYDSMTVTGGYTLAQAQAKTAITRTPDLFNTSGTLIGKIIVQDGAGIYSIEYPWTASFVGQSTTDHGALSGLGDDDHTQYLKESDTAAFATTITDTLSTYETVANVAEIGNDTTTWNTVSSLFDSVYHYTNVDSAVILDIYGQSATDLDILIAGNKELTINTTGIDIPSGNITVSGTVDGVDISVLNSNLAVDTANWSSYADSIGVDADDDGTFESYIYPAYIQKGTNVTLTVAGDTLSISSSGGSGLLDTLNSADTTVLVNTDTTLKITDDPTNDTTKVFRPSGTLVLEGGTGTPAIDFGFDVLDSVLADSIVNQKGVYDISTPSLNGATINGDLFIRNSIIQNDHFNSYKVEKARLAGRALTRIDLPIRGANCAFIADDTPFVVHPFVMGKEDGFFGSNRQLLMYYTPLLCSDTQENIHCAFGTDPYTWSEALSGVPAGGDTVANPIADINSVTPTAGHLSDPAGFTDIYDTTWCGFRVNWDAAGVDSTGLYVMYTTNGKTYSTPSLILIDENTDNMPSFMAPSWVKGDSSDVVMFCVSDTNTGASTAYNPVFLRYTASSMSSTYTVTDSIFFSPITDFPGKNLWHAEVKAKSSGEYVGIFACIDTGTVGGAVGAVLFVGQSYDKGITWNFSPQVMAPIDSTAFNGVANWDTKACYKSTFLFNTAGYLDVWYSALGWDEVTGSEWGVGKTEILFDGADTLYFSGSIYNPDGINDSIPIGLKFDSLEYPLGVNIEWLSITIDQETADTFVFAEWQNTSTVAPVAVDQIDTLITSGTASQASTSKSGLNRYLIRPGNEIWIYLWDIDIKSVLWEMKVTYEELKNEY